MTVRKTRNICARPSRVPGFIVKYLSTLDVAYTNETESLGVEVTIVYTAGLK